MTSPERFETVVVGGGQSGLAMGHYLARRGGDFVILDAETRIGDAWRSRWDSLRLFTPAAHSSLPGMPFPAPKNYYPTKDEMADYLEEYAGKFGLPVRLGRRVESVSRRGGGFSLRAGDELYEAENVVVASGPYRRPRAPGFAARLDARLMQIHSSEYRNPGQLPEGDVLVVGAGNSGAEIAVELAASRRVHLSGRDVGSLPAGFLKSRVFWWILDHVLTVDTRLGKKIAEDDRRRGDPLIRLDARSIASAGIERVPRVEGVMDGKPALGDGRTLEVSGVVWATGFGPDFAWIEPDVFDEDGYPVHRRGMSEVAGLYFLGLPFLHTPTSAMIRGVGKDARHIAECISPPAGGTGRRKPSAKVSG